MGRVFFSFLIIGILVTATIILIGFGRGYRPDFEKKTISPTGLLVASSDPTGAQIWLDGSLKSATNTTLTLAPGWYQVRLIKEGYLPWEKKLQIQGEVVSETQALLFPSTPALVPITTTGVIAPSLSPDGTKIVYAVPFPPEKMDSPAEKQTKSGLWILNLVLSPLGFRQDPQILARSTQTLDFSSGTLSWSPDSKQVLVTIGADHYLVKTDRENEPTYLTYDAWQNLLKDWQEEATTKEEKNLALVPQEFAKIATNSGKILSFSSDETKVLYQATRSANLLQILLPPPIGTNSTPEVRKLTSGRVYVYDIKEDKNFEISTLPGDPLSWFPSSRHLVEVVSDRISILEYDGTNKTTVYSGPFEKFVASLPGRNKFMILATLNRPAGTPPNLYSINLR